MLRKHKLPKEIIDVSFLKGEGGPFLLKRIWKNSGFLAGALAFFAIIFILSNMIWGVEMDSRYQLAPFILLWSYGGGSRRV